jgi:hypothetical protein
MTETQLRFLRAIAERIPVERMAELYLFPPMKQGVLETGIAIVAAEQEPETGNGEQDPGDVACDPTDDASRDSAETADPIEGTVPRSPSPVPPAVPHTAGYTAPSRHTVYTARYRVALKGPERGRWELHIMEEADAPLLTVEVVVRGVQRRAGEGADPERLEAAALRELLGAPSPAA